MKLTDFDVMRSKVTLKEKGVSEPTNAQIAMEFIRETRDSLLLQSDWRGNSDVTMSAEWKTYRQELRDLPANSNPSLDDELNLTNVTWPNKPT